MPEELKFICPDLPLRPPKITIPIIGGEFSSIIDVTRLDATDCQIAINTTQMLQPLLGMLKPYFDLFNCVLALIKFAQAVPDALGPPPSPGKLTSVVNDVSACLTVLDKIIPQLSIPPMIVGVLDLILVYISCIIEILKQGVMLLLDANEEEVFAKKCQRPKALDAVVCKRQQIVQDMNNKLAGLQDFKTFIDILNSLLGFVPGAPIVPQVFDEYGEFDIDLSDVGPINGTITALEGTKTTLTGIRNAVNKLAA